MTNKTHLERLKEKLAEYGSVALLITSEANQAWVSDFEFTDGYVLVTSKRAYVITDFRYLEAAKATLSSDFEASAPSSMYSEISSILKNEGIDTVMFEEETLSVAALDSLEEKLGIKKFLSGGSRLLDGLREYKDEHELELMAKAQDIADAAFAHILRTITPEMTEIEVALELEFFMRKNGASATSFSTIAVSGSASSFPHGVPRNVKLQKGFFTMDFGALYKGYCSDMTRTMFFGEPDEKFLKAYLAVLTAHLKCAEGITSGMTGSAADKIAREHLQSLGYGKYFTHSLGHGIGVNIHEFPGLSPKGQAELKENMVFSNEPGVYFDGKFGIRIEDTACIKDGKYSSFMKDDKSLVVISDGKITRKKLFR